MNQMSPLAKSSLLAALSPSATDVARQNLANAVASVLAAEERLTLINNRIVHDADGEKGAREEQIILRGQCVIEAQFELSTGVKLDAVMKAMGR